MVKRLLLSIVFMMLFAAVNAQWTGRVEIRTPHIAMCLSAEVGKSLTIEYLGVCNESVPMDDSLVKQFPKVPALPTFGTDDLSLPIALQATHSDGNPTTELVVSDYNSVADERSITHTFTMEDTSYSFKILVHYQAFRHTDVIETWTTIVNNEADCVTLGRFDSGVLPLSYGTAWLTHLHGSWANEFQMIEERLSDGYKVIANTDGSRNSQTSVPSVMLTIGEEKSSENAGLTLAATLAWSGNYELRVHSVDGKKHQLFAGINPQASNYKLKKGGSLETPHLTFTLSTEGKGGVSRNLHRWARNEKQLYRGMNMGDILLNSWEGVYFDVEDKTIKGMMHDLQQLGGELFVVDDGWFGNVYQRDNSSALGDWEVDRKKLKGGLRSLIKEAKRLGLKFGLWIEPEAVNTRSQLFIEHPHWVLQAKGHKQKMGRGETQLLLDMTNPEVQQFVYNIVDRLLTENPEIAYLKWDANVPLHNYGSMYLPADRQQNLYIDYHLGLKTTLERIRSKYPHVVIQDCASGGGRINYGLLPFFDEFWLSDNNDALERIYKQYGASLFFPANAIATHVGSSPDHTTGRKLPIKFRTDVAMNGRMGFELQPCNMTADEKRQAEQAISDYKQIRNVIQTGEQYRILTPYDGENIVATMYVDSEGNAVLLVYGTEESSKPYDVNIVLTGLREGIEYQIDEMNVAIGFSPCSLHGQTIPSRDLQTVGLSIPMDGGYSSRILYLQAKP